MDPDALTNTAFEVALLLLAQFAGDVCWKTQLLLS